MPQSLIDWVGPVKTECAGSGSLLLISGIRTSLRRALLPCANAGQFQICRTREISNLIQKALYALQISLIAP